jgi:hypothetical protein
MSSRVGLSKLRSRYRKARATEAICLLLIMCGVPGTYWYINSWGGSWGSVLLVYGTLSTVALVADKVRVNTNTLGQRAFSADVWYNNR